MKVRFFVILVTIVAGITLFASYQRAKELDLVPTRPTFTPEDIEELNKLYLGEDTSIYQE